MKKLVGACHERDVHVIMAGCSTTLAWPFPTNGCIATQQSAPTLAASIASSPGLQGLNFNNSCTQEFIRDVCLCWIDIFKIDGIRFDNTKYMLGADN